MSGAWQSQIGKIAGDLLTLEINTAIKSGMVAQKMPELPVALHAVIDTYVGGLTQIGMTLSTQLVRAAAAHIRDDPAITVKVLEQWFDPQMPRPAGWEDDPIPASDLTNGAETFEALQWAAYGALQLKRHAKLPQSDNLHNAEVKLYRIRANSRQLRAAAIILERRYSSGTEQDKQGRKARGEPETAEPGAAGYEERLDLVRNGGTLPIMPRLFGGTLERTAEALFKHPRPDISIAPDLAILVRKAWDVGLEDVMFQTS